MQSNERGRGEQVVWGSLRKLNQRFLEPAPRLLGRRATDRATGRKLDTEGRGVSQSERSERRDERRDIVSIRTRWNLPRHDPYSLCAQTASKTGQSSPRRAAVIALESPKKFGLMSTSIATRPGRLKQVLRGEGVLKRAPGVGDVAAEVDEDDGSCSTRYSDGRILEHAEGRLGTNAAGGGD